MVVKKIAVYFAGHFRNLDETWPQYIQIFKDTSEVSFDFYFTVWNVRNTNDPTPIGKETIYALCPQAKHVRILEGTIDTYDHRPPVAYQMYGIQEAFRDIPDSYDWYIRMRTDLYYFDTDFIKDILHVDADMCLPLHMWYTDLNYPDRDILNDYMWIGKYSISKHIATVYSHLNEHSPTYAEELLAKRIRTYPHPLRLHHFKCLFTLDRRTKGHEMMYPESRDLTQKRNEMLR